MKHNIESLLDRLVPNPAGAAASVDALRQKHPEMNSLQLTQRAIHLAKLRAATTGAATGAVSSPLTMIPAALADMGAVLAIEGSLIAEIGTILSPDAMKDPLAMKADIISIIFPAAASQALRQFGIRAGERLSQAALRKYATEDLVRTISRYATRFLGKQLTRETILAKAIPLVGMGIGAGWNWLEVQAIGARAIRYYSDEPIGPSPANTPPPSGGKVWNKVKQFLPRRRKEE